MADFVNWTGELFVSKAAASLAVLALTFFLQLVLRQAVLRHMAQSELRRRWIVNLRNVLILVALIAFASIWLDELRSFAAALVAFAVAFVVATKEFILCINGSLLRTATNAYSIGDRIEIGGHRGDVVDFTLFTTTLLEVGPGLKHHLRTGRTIIVPNSKLLDSYLINESSMKPYVLHVFSVPVEGEWPKAEKDLLQAAEEETAPFLDEARLHMKRLEREHGLEGLPVQPRVDLQLQEAGKPALVVRVPAPIGRQGRVEQAILRKFLARRAPEPGS